MLREVRDGDQGVSEEDESKKNEVVEDVKYHSAQGDVALLNGRTTEQVPQSSLPPPGPNIRWERFLPVRSLKVLLVEYDDSTRQVVAALLRNCSYEVIAVSNGLQAWNILQDLTHHVHLVLTDIVMPGLSGIGLLSKIMCHKTCKNIPVIMMSSNDSMGIVFKCLSKGAVDFLVKPIRKNELKNLWQHVWRRCHSSSGSGSESGIQNQKSAKPIRVDDSDNDNASSDEGDNGNVGLIARDGSDNGSGTQSSWTKRAVELESPQTLSPLDQSSDLHDSTCALVVHPKSENFSSQLTQMNAQKDSQEAKEPEEDHIMGKNLEIDESLQKGQKKNGKESGLEYGSDMTGTITDAPNGLCKTKENEEKSNHASTDLPALELSLKRPRPNRAINEDHTVLRHSDHSAFTKYNSSAASNQAPAVYGGNSAVPINNYSGAMIKDSTYNMISNSNAPPLKQGSDGSSNDNDVGSTAKNIFTKTATFKDKIQVQHHHHHYHHHHHHLHNMKQQEQDHDDLSNQHNVVSATQCGSSNVIEGSNEGIAANFSVNGSVSGSNRGSNGQNGSIPAVNTAMNIESDNGIGEKSTTGGTRNGSGSGSGNGSGSGSGLASNRFTEREAALTKFRQKRKERNFEKKVRYQSRKKLAEQRPRIRGQFVKQVAQENTSR